MFAHKKQILHGFAFAAGVAVYANGLSYLLSNAQHFAGALNGILGAAFMLILASTSAAIAGSLIFAKPILYAIQGERKNALHQLLYTIGWLVIFLIITISLAMIYGQNTLPGYY